MSARSSIIPVFVPHLGCPHACVFCNQRRITGHVRPASADTVREAIREAEKVPYTGKRELAFYGGSFTAIEEKHQIELLSAAKEAMEAGEIDAIRGVRCDRVVEGLVTKGLVRDRGRSEAVGRPILYGTTDEFLKHFGFESLKDLPEIEDIEEVIGMDEPEEDSRQMMLDIIGAAEGAQTEEE